MYLLYTVYDHLHEGKVIATIDWLLTPLYILIVYLIAKRTLKNNSDSFLYQKYYMKGLWLKIGGGLFFCFIYVYYYGGGDTTNYFAGGVALSNLLFYNADHYFSMLLGEQGQQTWYYFNDITGRPPWYMWRDPKSFIVIRLISPLMFISFKSYLPTTIILSWLSYKGIWKLFLFFNDYYPKIHKHLAYGILFMPSLIFWGSGIIKDTFTFSAVCWLVYSIYMIFIKKKKRIPNIIAMSIMVSILLAIKPYIFIALFPGAIFWVFHARLMKIKNPFIRIGTFPFIMIITIGIISVVFSSFKSSLGEYSSLDSVIEKAKITQEDLIREEQYGENYYNIGTIEGSFSSLISKMPLAIFSGLYRPALNEARSIVMLLSALENTFFLLFTLSLLWKSKVFKFFTIIIGDPLLLFCFSYAIFFGFSIGLTAANFGALVRYKIPAIPFLVTSLFLIKYYIDGPPKDELNKSTNKAI